MVPTPLGLISASNLTDTDVNILLWPLGTETQKTESKAYGKQPKPVYDRSQTQRLSRVGSVGLPGRPSPSISLTPPAGGNTSRGGVGKQAPSDTSRGGVGKQAPTLARAVNKISTGGRSSESTGATGGQSIRRQALRKVYRVLDAERDEILPIAKLKALTRSRSALGANVGDWSEERDKAWNLSLLKGGGVTMESFVDFFHDVLPQSTHSFDMAIEGLTAIALAARSKARAGTPSQPRPKRESPPVKKLPPPPPSRPPPACGIKTEDSKQVRYESLECVFQAFDLDGSGDVSKVHLEIQ